MLTDISHPAQQLTALTRFIAPASVMQEAIYQVSGSERRFFRFCADGFNVQKESLSNLKN